MASSIRRFRAVGAALALLVLASLPACDNERGDVLCGVARLCRGKGGTSSQDVIADSASPVDVTTDGGPSLRDVVADSAPPVDVTTDGEPALQDVVADSAPPVDVTMDVECGACPPGSLCVAGECAEASSTRIEYIPDSTVSAVVEVSAWASEFATEVLRCTPTGESWMCDLPADPGEELQVWALLELQDGGAASSCFANGPCAYGLRGTIEYVSVDGVRTDLVPAWSRFDEDHCWTCNAALGSPFSCDPDLVDEGCVP